MTTSTKTILFFPLNSPGHVNSSLGIADRLKDDYGLRTVFLVLGPPIGNTILEHGHELHIVDEKNVYEDYEKDPEGNVKSDQVKKQYPGARKWPQICARYMDIFAGDPVDAIVQTMGVFEKSMVEEVIENMDAYDERIHLINPDMIIVDAYFIPPSVVKRTDIPWVRLFSANPIQVIKSKLPDGLKPPALCGYKVLTKEKRRQMIMDNPEEWQAILDSWRVANGRIGEAIGSVIGSISGMLSEHGLEPPKGELGHESPHINLYMYPKELDYDQEDDILHYSPRWFRCDSLIRKQDETNSAVVKLWSEKLETAMKGKTGMVFFSLGSIASGDLRLMKKYIDILKHDEKRLYVISKGVYGDKFELNSSNMIGDNYVPQTFLLQKANLAIVHGGNNSVTECMYYGVPVIILPVFADQLDNAQRIVDLDLGKRFNAFTCLKDELLSAIDEIMSNETLIERTRSIGVAMRSREDSRKISFMLKKLAEDGKLDQGFIDDCRNKSFEDIES